MLSFNQFIIHEAAITAKISDNEREIAHKMGWRPINKPAPEPEHELMKKFAKRIPVARKIGRSGKKDHNGDMTVLWYHHPRMGLRVIDHEGTHSPITHAQWMHQEGIKKPQEFDRLPRGRFHIHGLSGNVHEFLHTGKETPDSVYNHMKKHYGLNGKLFTDHHKITRVSNS